MLTVNKQEYSKNDFELRLQTYENMEHFQEVNGKRFALCITDPFDIITLVFFLKQKKASVLLIHGETPKDTAIEMAKRAECFGILYGDFKQFITLNGEHEIKKEPSLLQYSSGTTGEPKLIERPWEEIEREIDAYNQALQCEVDEVPIVLAPVSHSYGLICGTLSAIMRGSKPIVITSKNPKFALNIIRNTPKHIIYAVPLMLHIMGSFPQETFQFHKVMTSGSPLPESLFYKLKGMTKYMMQQYGCSEAGCISICHNMNTHLDLGEALPHAFIRISGDQNEPEEIVVTIGEKVIYTKDLGYRSERGLHFVGRMDDVINVSGLKVFPVEVEETMLRLDGIQEAIVYRGKHPVMGEIVKAKVISSIEPVQIREWCIQHLPSYKVPHEIENVTEIPKNATGKVSRKLLEMEEMTT
ncbi:MULTISPECIES: AMP-binding protein [Bacillus cereus group]|uniref:AMP-binding protein n=1 Tax=Bacillus cereus group TaxID=86661 RepID=UPI000BF9C5B4|nr:MULTISPECIES: AMP-binding protein [Bacillus cereus group]PFA18601.1 acyl-CoA synthetase [Bacillus cereus]PGZ19432.1 acyl-CoA synthetase [Bacillus cereus]